jgi:hypothetical protein
MLPYIVADVLAFGSESGRSQLQQEIMSVLREGHKTREGELCVQAIFELLDMMRRTSEETSSKSSGEDICPFHPLQAPAHRWLDWCSKQTAAF